MYRVLKIVLPLLIAVLVVLVAVPNFLSSSYIKQQVEVQLSDMLGRQVLLNGDSSVSVTPYLGVSYRNVTVRQAAASAELPLVAVEGLKAKLGLFSTIWGKPQVVEVELLRPSFNLMIAEDGTPNWRLEKGPLAERFSLPEGEKPRSFPLGAVVIEDGIVEITDARHRTTEKLTSLNGTVSWTGINAPGSAQLSAVWRGEIVHVAANATSPFEILRGGPSDLNVTFKANPLTLVFNGHIDTADVPFAKGKLEAATPSPKRFADWFGQSIPAAELLPEVSLDGEVTATMEKMDFPSVALKVGQNQGVGQLQLVRPQEQPISVNGTLAFETLRIKGPDEIVLPEPGAVENAVSSTDIDFSFLYGMNVDIQVSAGSGAIGPLSVEKLAASAVINNGKASFDVGQAQALGGALTGSLSLNTEQAETTVAADIDLKTIDLAQLAALYGADDTALKGSGSAVFNLKSTGTNPKTLLRKLKGTADIQGTDGEFKGIDLGKLAEATAENIENFDADIFSGQTTYSELQIAVSISNGVAYLRDSRMTSQNFRTFLTGRTDLPRQSLALSGRVVRPVEGDENYDAVDAFRFFIGGTTTAPLFVPLAITKKSQAAPGDGFSLEQTEIEN